MVSSIIVFFCVLLLPMLPNDDGALLCLTTIGLCCHSMQNSQQCSGSSARSRAALHFECFRFTSFALAIVSRNRQIIQFLPIEPHCSRNCGLLLLLRHCAMFVREVCTTEYARSATRDELPLGCGRGGLCCAHKWKPNVIQLNERSAYRRYDRTHRRAAKQAAC